MRSEQVRPPAASTLSECEVAPLHLEKGSDTLPSGGPGAVTLSNEERIFRALEREFGELEEVEAGGADSVALEKRTAARPHLHAAYTFRRTILEHLDEIQKYRVKFWHIESGKADEEYAAKLEDWKANPLTKAGRKRPRPRRAVLPKRPEIPGL